MKFGNFFSKINSKENNPIIRYIYFLFNFTDALSIIAILIPLIALAIIGFSFYHIIFSFIMQNSLLEKTYNLSLTLEKLLVALIDAETGQRGYTIMHNTEYLQPYDASLEDSNNGIQNLLKTTADNDDQQFMVKEKLTPLIKNQTAILEQLIDIKNNQNVSSALSIEKLMSDEKSNMDKIRLIIQELENQQGSLLFLKSKSLNDDSKFVLFALTIGIVLIFAITAITILVITNRLKSRNSSMKRKLESEINKQTIEIKESNLELRNLNEQLQIHSQKQKDFVNTAAHELRTPTQAITGYSEMNETIFNDILNSKLNLYTKTKTNQSNESFYQVSKNTLIQIINYQKLISKNSSRLVELTNDLLDVARFDSNSHITLYKEKMDLFKEIENNLINGSLAKKIKEKNIKVNFNLDKTDIGFPVFADRIKLIQILNNLIDNSIKFSKFGDRITISSTKYSASEYLLLKNRLLKSVYGIQNTKKISENKEEWKRNDSIQQQLIISVSDEGKGISSKIKPHLFERFATDSEYGTGLGLYITKKLVEAHGGEIWALNNRDKKGATFVFSLPLVEQ